MKFLRSGWFIAGLFVALLAYAAINHLLWWSIFFVAFGGLLGVAEIACKRWTGYTLSEQFGQFYSRRPVRGRWFFVVLIAVVVGLVVHLWAWRA